MSKKLLTTHYSLLTNRVGQSLVEVLIGLSVGAIIIGGATIAISSVLRSNVGIERNQSASTIGQELIDKVNAWSGESWQNLYGLTKGTSTQYYLNASSSRLFVVQGKEGILDNDVTNGLVGEWKFDEDVTSTSTTTYDATGNNNNGTLTNSPTRASSTCKIGNCLSFNGVDAYVTAENTNNITTGDFTITAWVNTNALDGAYHCIITKNAAAYPNYQLCISPSNVFQGGYEVSSGNSSLATSSAISTGIWYNIAISADRTNGTALYVDGDLINTIAAKSGSLSNSDTLYIGRHSSGFYWNGYIDDVRIYNLAFSADDVKRLYNNRIFTRWFSVENVCRTADSSSTISGVSPCAGGSSDDPSTQKVTATVEWNNGASTLQAALASFVTRWKNATFQQTDWSSGLDASGFYTGSSKYYSSSSNVNATSSSGSFRLWGI
ncbi:MAG: LamG domain-containing protein [Candidatus Jorgensenbacteria bacterium]|nr:LamG domain-containing protein [Candidatus Jorgensenbacteria bacterium]